MGTNSLIIRLLIHIIEILILRTLSAEWHRHTETPQDFLLVLWPSDSFCGKFDVYCFNNI